MQATALGIEEETIREMVEQPVLEGNWPLLSGEVVSLCRLHGLKITVPHANYFCHGTQDGVFRYSKEDVRRLFKYLIEERQFLPGSDWSAFFSAEERAEAEKEAKVCREFIAACESAPMLSLARTIAFTSNAQMRELAFAVFEQRVNG